MPSLFRASAIFGLLISPAVAASTAPPGVEAMSASQKPAHVWNWLTKEDEKRLLAAIPPKPAPGSAEDKQDLQEVRHVQQTSSEDDKKQARDFKDFKIELLTSIVGSDFTGANDPVTFRLLERVREDESDLNTTLKLRYARNRPYKDHPEVKALFGVDGYSYPSGHASGSEILADILAKLFPQDAAALHARADAIGQSRVVAGVHYPSDVKEGQKLADALADALEKNAAFKTDLAAAQAEIARGKTK